MSDFRNRGIFTLISIMEKMAREILSQNDESFNGLHSLSQPLPSYWTSSNPEFNELQASSRNQLMGQQPIPSCIPACIWYYFAIICGTSTDDARLC